MPAPVRKAIFPVGGLGTRFLPATRAIPKEMLPVVDKPLIQYAVEEALEAGIEQCIFVTGRGKTAIEDHFDHAGDLRAMLAARGRQDAMADLDAAIPAPGRFFYTRQQEPLGLGHAVWCARDAVGDEPVAVLLPDDLILAPRGCLAQMLAAYRRVGGNMLAVMAVAPEKVAAYGVVAPGRCEGSLVEVRGLVEKPEPTAAPSDLAVIGRYILQPPVFDALARLEPGAGGEIQLTDALARQIGAAPVHGWRFEGRRFDCGTKAGFLEANLAFALARDDLREPVAAFLAEYG